MVKYLINEKKGIVTAWFEDGGLSKRELMENELYGMLRNRCNNTRLYLLLYSSDVVEQFMDRYSDDRSFVGIAQCSPADTFDKEVGKKIAFDRLREKEHRMINKFTFFVMDWLDRFIHDHRLPLIPVKE